jgi:hypothetical protein
MTKKMKILIVTVPEVTDPERKARILKQLHGRAALTYELGVAAAEAGIHFDEWSHRCLKAWEFRRGWKSAVVATERPDLTVSEDFEIINKATN